MSKFLSLLCFIVVIFTASAQTNTDLKNSDELAKTINTTIENWHAAAGEANFNAYFDLIAENGIFIGTDATENWVKDDFMSFAKPYFDRGKAWDFKTLERNIFLSSTSDLGWFDELLDTQMGICRGSGVVTKINDQWKIQHYVLSIAIPNENVPAVAAMKKTSDSNLIKEINEKK